MRQYIVYSQDTINVGVIYIAATAGDAALARARDNLPEQGLALGTWYTVSWATKATDRRPPIIHSTSFLVVEETQQLIVQTIEGA
jgi:hypothetical protein